MGREELRLRAQWLAHWQGMVTRIEPNIGSTFGAPDTFLVNEQVDGWIEFKVVSVGGTIEIRPAQRNWHEKYSAFRRNSAFVVLCNQGFWILPARTALRAPFVQGECVDWPIIRADMLTMAVKTAYEGRVFNRKTIEQLIEPHSSWVGNHGQEREGKAQGSSTDERAAKASRLRY
jgi:hypothetical protein